MRNEDDHGAGDRLPVAECDAVHLSEAAVCHADNTHAACATDIEGGASELGASHRQLAEKESLPPAEQQVVSPGPHRVSLEIKLALVGDGSGEGFASRRIGEHDG